MTRLTAHQRAVLAALDRCYRNGPTLRTRAIEFHGLDPDTEVEGLHATAASLVRRGLASKAKIGGTVHYELTDAGRIAQKKGGPSMNSLRSLLP